MGETNKNAVTLVRVSTKKQGGEDRFGMDAQRRSNERIVAEKGFLVRKTIEYKDVSGDAVLYTPEMQELQEYLHTAQMKGGNLVAKELSRLLRPNYKDYPLLQVFVDQRISIHLPHYVLQLWTPEGRTLASILCSNDFNEAERIRDRCMGGREEARRRGFCAAGGRTIPTGVTWDVKTKTWAYDNIYAPKIAEAFRMVADGETNFGYIIRKLKLCLRPSQGVPKLATATSLRRLLENRMFIGERVTNRKFDLSVPTEKLMHFGKDRRWRKKNRPLIDRDPQEVYVTPVITPGLVGREMFEKVQIILRAKSDKVHQAHALHSDRPKFAYRGLLFCADCGQPLYTVTRGRDGYYRCRDHFRHRGGKSECKAPSMSRRKLEGELDWLFSRQFPRTHFLTAMLKKHLESESRKDAARQRERFLMQRETLEKKRERIIDLAADGVITKPDCDRRLTTVNDDLEVNGRMLAEFVVDAPLPTYREWCDIMRPFRNFAVLPPEEKRRLITSRFQEIRVKEHRVVSLYLLTGEVVIPDAKPREQEADPNTCYSCGRIMRHSEPPIGKENYCGPCLEGMAQGGSEDWCAIALVPTNVQTCNDTSQRL